MCQKHNISTPPDLDPCLSSNKIKYQELREGFESVGTLLFSATIL